jgi:hypothetical protein
MIGKGEKRGRLRVVKGFRVMKGFSVVKGLMVWGRIKGGEKGEGSRLGKRGGLKFGNKGVGLEVGMAGKVEGLRLGKRGWVKDGKGDRVTGGAHPARSPTKIEKNMIFLA